MSASALGITIAAACGLWYLLRFAGAAASWRKSAIKTLSVATLAVAVWLGGGPALLVAALALGSLGDLMLSLDSKRAFLAGLVAFALSHLAYIGLLTATGGWTLPGLPLLGALALFAAIMGGVLWPRTGNMRWPVMAYIAIISSMGAAAFGLSEWCQPWLWAALLFMASDTVLSAELFVLRADHPVRRLTPLAVWASYWAAQMLFAWPALA